MLSLERSNVPACQFNLGIAGQITAICQPLFNHFDISNFGYVKLLPDGKMCRLSTDDAWTRHYFTNQFYNDLVFYDFTNTPIGTTSTKIISASLLDAPALKDNLHFSELYQHNIWNIFLIYQRNAHDVEVWFFASTKENSHIIDFYLKHPDVLTEFTQYFRQRSEPILTEMTETDFIQTNITLAQPRLDVMHRIDSFFNEINFYTKKFNIQFTKREKDCLNQLILGRSSREIAAVLEISPRTVQSHIERIKHKTNCKKITEVIRLFYTGELRL